MKVGAVRGLKDFLARLVRSPGLYFDAGWSTRRYWFSLGFIAVLCAKILHIYSHLNSLSVGRFLLWGSTFFLPDVLFIFILRALTRNFSRRWVRGLAALVVVPLSIGTSFMAAANTSFYIFTGAEIHWRQVHSFHRDAAAIKYLLTGLTGLIIVELIYIVASYFATPYLYNGVGEVLRVLSSSAASVCCFWRRKKDLPDPKVYEEVALDDYDDDKSDTDSTLLLGAPPTPNQESSHSLLKRLLILLPTTVILVLRCFRPPNPAYGFLSETLVATPFSGDGKGHHHRHTLLHIEGLHGDYSWLGNRTALSSPPKFDWLPADLDGFRDWGTSPKNKDPYVHYSPKQDPLHISNLQEEVIKPFRDALHSGKAKIKHVILLKLESTREDVFPLRKGSYMHDRVKETWGSKIPDEVIKRLAKLSKNSERLTGTPSGFNKEPPTPYGGLHATNSFTAGTFTLKSLTATICGANPLVVDFNREYQHHIYQPCMPHILGALNAQANDTQRTSNFTSWPWQSAFMQAVTDEYDNQVYLTPAHGYNMDLYVNVPKIDADRGRNASAPEEADFWGWPDTYLGKYVREAINKAEKNKERLFLTHLTGLTHVPWHMPNDEFEDFVKTGWSSRNDKLNRYLNTISFIDGWIGDIFDILKETGVADETLVVMTGDHGISLPEDGGITPYDNPHVSNFHVPLVFSHPHLPHVELNSSVTSLQILPTILDLLRESDSLSNDALAAINNLLPMYEGQSMIRPIIQEKDGLKNWQFTVMNTGGTWLSLRSADKPYRLVIPLVPDVEWRFSNLEKDPKEWNTVMSFDVYGLLDMVAWREGNVAVQWINDAAHVAEWWVSENWRRYEYAP